MYLTEVQLQAVALLVEGRVVDEAIARRCGTSLRTLYRWKKLPEFAAEVERRCEAFSQALAAASAREYAKELDESTKQTLAAMRRRRSGSR
jgi:hypothetical protein